MSPDLESRAEIAELNASFAWALDRQEWDSLRHVLAGDVRYVGVGGELNGSEAVIASFRSRPTGRTTRHGLGNLSLSDGPGDTVLGRSSWHTFAGNGPVVGVPLFMVADFDDIYARDERRRWRIAERVITPVFRDHTRAPLFEPPEVDPRPAPLPEQPAPRGGHGP